MAIGNKVKGKKASYLKRISKSDYTVSKKPRKKEILILHGPNLNLLGVREPEVYGTMTFNELNAKIKEYAKRIHLKVKIRQSNSEGELIDIIQDAHTWAGGIVFNPGAYTHYSYALRDAVAGILVPTVEVHLSDIQNREDFRKVSVISPVCVAQFSGQGAESYFEGVKFLSTWEPKKNGRK